MSRRLTFEDLARAMPEAAECAAIALFRRASFQGHPSQCITETELLEAEGYQLVGETSADGKSMTLTLERRAKIL